MKKSCMLLGITSIAVSASVFAAPFCATGGLVYFYDYTTPTPTTPAVYFNDGNLFIQNKESLSCDAINNSIATGFYVYTGNNKYGQVNIPSSDIFLKDSEVDISYYPASQKANCTGDVVKNFSDGSCVSMYGQ